MNEIAPIKTYPLLGKIIDKRNKNKTTVNTFLNNLKLTELLKTEKTYQNLPFKLLISHNERTVTLQLAKPWKLLSKLKSDLILVISEFSFADLSSSIETRYACLDKVILWFNKYLLRLEQLTSIIDEKSYLSIFAIWDYIYGVTNYHGNEKLSINIDNQLHENEITAYLSNLTQYDYVKDRQMFKDGFPHYRTYQYITEITINMFKQKEIRLLSVYDVYWSLINLNIDDLDKPTDQYDIIDNPYIYSEILETNDVIKLNKSNSIISLNLYDHFNHTHFHNFISLEEFKMYLFEKIYKSWNARLLTVPLEHDRLYYGVISNLRLWLNKNMDSNATYYTEQERILRCLHMLQGMFPMMYTQVKPFPEFCKLINLILNDQIITTALLELWDYSDMEFNNFPMLSDMGYYIANQPSFINKTRHALIKPIRIAVEIVTNLKSFDVMQYKFKINQIGYPNYSSAVDPNNLNLIFENKETEFRFSLWADDINSFYKINFPENNLGGNDVTDELFIKYVKHEYQFREVFKQSFKNALRPEVMLKTTGYHDSSYSFTEMDKIIMQSYCYKENVQYTHISPEAVDIVVHEGELNNDFNLSTLKLLQAFCYMAYKATQSWEFLTKRYNILILGGVLEPLSDVLRRMSNNQYNIDVIGREAFGPNLRGDLENIILNKNYHFVISDIDQTDMETVDQIGNKFCNHLLRIDSIASLGCIIKCNYLTEDIINKLNGIYNNRTLFSYEVMQSGASTIGSYETFFCGTGDKLRGIAMPIEIAKLYKSYSAAPDINDNFTLYQSMTELPVNINWFNRNKISNMYKNTGQTFSILCHQKDLVRVLGTMLSMCSKVSYGNTEYGKDNTLMRVSGITNYSRMTFTKLIGNLGSPNNNNVLLNGGYYPANDKLILRTSSPGKSFGFGQRLSLLIAVRFLITSQNMIINRVIDIGCRDFESIILANALAQVDEYTGYDMNPIALRFPQYSKIRFINQKINLQSLLNIITTNNYSLIVAYNSIFMSAETKNDLINLVTNILQHIVEVSHDGDRQCMFVFSLYMCELDGIDEYKQIGTVEEKADGVYFTLDRGQPVATLTSDEWTQIINTVGIDGNKINRVHTAKEQIYYGCATNGTIPNQKSLTLNYLYNMCQPIIMVNY